jgi:hypothetical protein
MSGCLIVDSDDEFVAPKMTKNCCMAGCKNRHSNDGFFCDSCVEENTKATEKYLQRKEKYIEYKNSQVGVVGFGKYKDKTVEWLVDNDRGYCRWLIKQNGVSLFSRYENQPQRITKEIIEIFERRNIEYSF